MSAQPAALVTDTRGARRKLGRVVMAVLYQKAIQHAIPPPLIPSHKPTIKRFSALVTFKSMRQSGVGPFKIEEYRFQIRQLGRMSISKKYY